MKTRLCLIVALLLSVVPATAQRYVRSFPTIDALLAATPADVSTNAWVSGRNSQGDGGEGNFYYSASSSTATNLGTIHKPNGFGGRWFRSSTATVYPEWFGAYPGLTTDQSTAMQAAIDYAEANGSSKVVFRAGIWVGQITIRTATVEGVWSSQNYPNALIQSCIVQPASPTGPTITITNKSGAYSPTLRNINVVGRGGTTTPNKKAITAVIDRFTIKVADADAPTLYTVQDFPSNVAMFYTSEGGYLGSAFVTTTSSSLGETTVNLDPEYTQYAPTTVGGTLTTADKVVWSPGHTFGAATFPNPGYAGYPGILMSANLMAKIENVSVIKHHVGIHIQNSGSTPNLVFGGQVSINGCEFAGISSPSGTMSADTTAHGAIYVSGSYLPATYGLLSLPAETITIYNTPFRRTSFAMWNTLGGAGSMWNQLVLDGAITGSWDGRTPSAQVNSIFVDNAITHGCVVKSGYYTTVSGTGLVIDNLLVRNLNTTDSIISALTNKTALTVDGTAIAATVHIGTINVAAWLGTAKWDRVFNCGGLSANLLSIGKKVNLDGANAIGYFPNFKPRWIYPYDVTNSAHQAEGWYNPSSGKIVLSQIGEDIVELAQSGLRFNKDILTATRITSTSTNSFEVASGGGTPRLRVNAQDGISRFYGPDGVTAASEPSYNSGTVLSLVNNGLTADRARLAVVGGASGFSMVELGPSLGAGLQLDSTTGNLTVKNNNTAAAVWDSAKRLAVGTSVTTPDASAALDVQSTTLGFKLPVMTADPSSPADGLLWYRSDQSLPKTRANGVTKFVRLGTAIKASATLDFPSTSAQSENGLTISVPGAAVGDVVHLGIPNAATTAGSCYTAWVSATDTVTVRFSNYGSVSRDPASGTFTVVVEQY